MKIVEYIFGHSAGSMGPGGAASPWNFFAPSGPSLPLWHLDLIINI